MQSIERPKVGVGVIIENDKKEILIGKRKGSHSPYFSIPGGHLEMGETFEEAAIKEVFEETGLKIEDPVVISVTNNLRTFQESGRHYISVILFADKFEGVPVVKEKDKCEGWQWCALNDLPQPHFDASEHAIQCYQEGNFYIKDQV